MLMDGLAYAAATRGQPLHLEYLTTTDPLPDFHSGYKFFSRATAEAVFGQEPALMGMSESAAYRHACEAVMTVEAHLSGATLAAVNRRTYDEQPISLFANYNRARLAADMILWPCKRLGVPASFVSASGGPPPGAMRYTCRSYGFFCVLVNVSVPSAAISTREATSHVPALSAVGAAAGLVASMA